MARENPTSPPTGILTFLGGLLTLAIFAFAVLLWIHHTAPGNELSLKRANARRAAQEKLNQQYADQLNSLGWVDKKAGIAHIPIDDAMKKTVALLGKKAETKTAVPLDPVLPPVVVDPNSKDPAPVALPSAPQGANTVRFDIPEATGVYPVATPAPAPGAAAPAPAAAPAAPAPTTSAPAAPAPAK